DRSEWEDPATVPLRREVLARIERTEPEELARLVEEYLADTGPEDRRNFTFDPQRLDRPDWDGADAVETWEQWVRRWVAAERASITEPLRSPRATVNRAMALLRGQLARIVRAGAVDAASELRDIDGWFAGISLALASGPPPERTARLLALVEAGIVDLLGENSEFDVDGATLVGRSPARGEVHARAFIETRMSKGAVDVTDDPLINSLKSAGAARLHAKTSAAGEPVLTRTLDVTPGGFALIGAAGGSRPRRRAGPRAAARSGPRPRGVRSPPLDGQRHGPRRRPAPPDRTIRTVGNDPPRHDERVLVQREQPGVREHPNRQRIGSEPAQVGADHEGSGEHRPHRHVRVIEGGARVTVVGNRARSGEVADLEHVRIADPPGPGGPGDPLGGAGDAEDRGGARLDVARGAPGVRDPRRPPPRLVLAVLADGEVDLLLRGVDERTHVRERFDRVERVPPQPPRGTGVDRSLAPVVFQVLHAPGEHLLQVLLLACPRTEVFAPGGPWIEPGKGRAEPVEGASTPPDAVGVPDLCARAPAGREVEPEAQPPGADLLPEGRHP